jgi:hypothetical protein
MMKPRKPVPRPVAIFAPPAIALLLATGYFKYQERDAERETVALCARFEAGGVPVTEFALAAKAAGFQLAERGHGTAVKEVIASREVAGFQTKVFRCRAIHDGTTLVRAESAE